jgi:hypothetical protein
LYSNPFLPIFFELHSSSLILHTYFHTFFLIALTSLRLALVSRRFSFELQVGAVLLRDFAGSAAFLSSSTRRLTASSLFFS